LVFTATRRRLGVVQAPENAVAVEDSASGVGSASNANVGFIVGYVGGTHVAPSLKESHARMLMRGERATSGRGAEIVIEDMKDLATLVAFFAQQRKLGNTAPFVFPPELGLVGTFFLPQADNP
jgi:beta-phosphoglucomutase-like phosphatase (HAD superfamily)